MFNCESGFLVNRKKHGQREAIELIADINAYTMLVAPKDKQRRKNGEAEPHLNWQRTLFDRNEHFVELSNMGEEERSLMTLLSAWIMGLLLLALAGAIFFTKQFGVSDIPYLIFVWVFPLGAAWFLYMLWPLQYAPNFFTLLRARYRFNRTTGKVYVLRPKRYGGNVILDWDRVRAHVNWCAPRGMVHDDLRDPVAREARQSNRGGAFGIRGLVLYWPPFDKEDKDRKGEDVLWVGPKLAGENLWQYIRTFMEEGIDKVPEPCEFEWLRKGFHTMGQHIEETVLGSSRALDAMGRAEGRESSSETSLNFMLNVWWAPLHWVAERLCYWPTFPAEWNSDCGQTRREDGIGPEKPLQWPVKP